jgi:hypothetical protein
VIGNLRDQGTCSASWAIAAISVIESAITLKTN